MQTLTFNNIYIPQYSMATYQGEQFGQRRPPLSVTIKGILERYPDGQIFKVKKHVIFESYLDLMYMSTIVST